MANQDPGGYVAVAGFDHDPSKTRVEAGDPVPASLPDKVIKSLLEQGAIEKAPQQKGGS